MKRGMAAATFILCMTLIDTSTAYSQTAQAMADAACGNCSWEQQENTSLRTHDFGGGPENVKCYGAPDDQNCHYRGIYFGSCSDIHSDCSLALIEAVEESIEAGIENVLALAELYPERVRMTASSVEVADCAGTTWRPFDLPKLVPTVGKVTRIATVILGPSKATLE